MLIKLITFFIWVGVSASGIYWVIPLTASPHDTNQAPIALTPEPQGNWIAVMGEKRIPPEPPKPSISANQFKLLGLAAATQTGQNHGVALMTFQDQSARSYKVGSKINDKLVVLDISKQKVTIGLAEDPKNEKEYIYLEAALLPPAEQSKVPPSGASNSNKSSNSGLGIMPRSGIGYPSYNSPALGYNPSPPSYNNESPTPYRRRGGPPGMPPNAYNPETGGTPGYPSPPPTDNPMY